MWRRGQIWPSLARYHLLLTRFLTLVGDGQIRLSSNKTIIIDSVAVLPDPAMTGHVWPPRGQIWPMGSKIWPVATVGCGHRGGVCYYYIFLKIDLGCLCNRTAEIKLWGIKNCLPLAGENFTNTPLLKYSCPRA